MANKSRQIYSDRSLYDNTPSASDANVIKTIQRRGNTYVIKEQLSDDDLYEQMSEDLYVETIHLSMLANRRAKIFKFFQIIGTLYLIICGTVIGVLTLESYSGSVTLYIAAILGFSITAIQTILSTFSFEKRSVLLKYISNKLRKISREIKIVQSSDIKYKKKMAKLEDLFSEVDDLDVSMFDSNIGSGSIRSGTNIALNRTITPFLIKLKRGEVLEEPNQDPEPQHVPQRKWSVSNILKRCKKESPELPVKMKDSDLDRKLEEDFGEL